MSLVFVGHARAEGGRQDWAMRDTACGRQGVKVEGYQARREGTGKGEDEKTQRRENSNAYGEKRRRRRHTRTKQAKRQDDRRKPSVWSCTSSVCAGGQRSCISSLRTEGGVRFEGACFCQVDGQVSVALALLRA